MSFAIEENGYDEAVGPAVKDSLVNGDGFIPIEEISIETVVEGFYRDPDDYSYEWDDSSTLDTEYYSDYFLKSEHGLNYDRYDHIADKYGDMPMSGTPAYLTLLRYKSEDWHATGYKEAGDLANYLSESRYPFYEENPDDIEDWEFLEKDNSYIPVTGVGGGKTTVKGAGEYKYLRASCDRRGKGLRAEIPWKMYAGGRRRARQTLTRLPVRISTSASDVLKTVSAVG